MCETDIFFLRLVISQATYERQKKKKKSTQTNPSAHNSKAQNSTVKGYKTLISLLQD